jgi:NitT/TauT family transport system ATP-binding protein
VFESAYLSSRIVVMRARPGQVYSDLPIAQPEIRDGAYRVSEFYRANCQTVSDALQSAIQSAES